MQKEKEINFFMMKSNVEVTIMLVNQTDLIAKSLNQVDYQLSYSIAK